MGFYQGLGHVGNPWVRHHHLTEILIFLSVPEKAEPETMGGEGWCGQLLRHQVHSGNPWILIRLPCEGMGLTWDQSWVNQLKVEAYALEMFFPRNVLEILSDK